MSRWSLRRAEIGFYCRQRRNQPALPRPHEATLFMNLQALSKMAEGRLIADVVCYHRKYRYYFWVRLIGDPPTTRIGRNGIH